VHARSLTPTITVTVDIESKRACDPAMIEQARQPAFEHNRERRKPDGKAVFHGGGLNHGLGGRPAMFATPVRYGQKSVTVRKHSGRRIGPFRDNFRIGY
jgi:hypothetical protein